jgi:hypothetical protein
MEPNGTVGDPTTTDDKQSENVTGLPLETGYQQTAKNA